MTNPRIQIQCHAEIGKPGDCEGTGEILVFNPVIPKGLLGARNR